LEIICVATVQSPSRTRIGVDKVLLATAAKGSLPQTSDLLRCLSAQTQEGKHPDYRKSEPDG
jgi:hypothetical protein